MIENYFAALASAINDENLNSQAFTDYLNLTGRVIKEKTKQESYDFFKKTRTFFERRSLYTSRASELNIANDNYRFAFVEAEIYVEPEPEPEEEVFEEDPWEENDFDEWDEEEEYADDEWGSDWEDDYEELPEEELSMADILEEAVATREVLGPAILFDNVDLIITTPYDTGVRKNAKGLERLASLIGHQPGLIQILYLLSSTGLNSMLHVHTLRPGALN